MTTFSHRRHLIGAILLFVALLAWDDSSLDMAMAAWFGGPAGFPLKEHWLFTAVLHEGARAASWLLLVALCVMVWWPAGPFRRIDIARRLQVVLTALVAVLAVSGFKSFSRTSCPWDLAAFGRVAQHISHWAWATSDGGTGRCFPAGHASAGFGFFGGYFAFAERAPALAKAWFAAALLAGLLLGIAQQARGAHFMSHTLWTGWICWCVALGVDALRELRGFGSVAEVGSDAA
jgi:membrane-associated PAP2 superfamily phosphatase